MELHQERVALPFHSHAPHRALDAPHDGLGSEYPAGAMAGGTRLGHALEMALSDALASHLDESEVTYGNGAGEGAVATQVAAHLLQDAVPVPLRLHVNEVDDNDAADIAQAELSGH